MKLYAISDLHLSYEINRKALTALRPFPEDWIIVAGDVSESEVEFAFALEAFTKKFAKVIWVPGNHDLWTMSQHQNQLRGEKKYLHWVSMCRDAGVLTPEDPFVRWTGEGQECILAPLFLLYDYSFRPSSVSLDSAVEWSSERGVVCADEAMLHSDPYPTRIDWCHERVRYSRMRLEEARSDVPFVLINHWPLREDLLRLGWIPTFSLWCGTKETESWHNDFPTIVTIFGHIHVRERTYRDGVRFEEVSLGYPRDWRQERGMEFYLREILPGPNNAEAGFIFPKQQ